MCGIFGYVGETLDVGPTVLDALRALEYRGYDSWGIAVGDRDRVRVVKRTGKINGATVDLTRSDIAFGHTRWATHGGVTQANAHPHLDCTGRLAIIHNGIVENFRDLRDGLIARGHEFRSETDTEVIAHLIEEEVADGATDVANALASVFTRLEGLSAIIVLDLRSRSLIAAKNVSPLV